MTLPTFVGVGTIATAATGDVTPGIHASSQADDLLICLVEHAFQPPTMAVDWTQATDSPQGGGTAGAVSGRGISAFWKIHDGSEADPIVNDASGSDHLVAVVLTFRGTDLTNPFNVTSGADDGVSDTSVECPGDTTTVADCLCIMAVGRNNDAAATTTTSWTNSDLANIAARFGDSGTSGTTLGNGGGLGVATGEKTTAGSVGTSTATVSATCTKAYWFAALQPPQGGTPAGFSGWGVPV